MNHSNERTELENGAICQNLELARSPATELVARSKLSTFVTASVTRKVFLKVSTFVAFNIILDGAATALWVWFQDILRVPKKLF